MELATLAGGCFWCLEAVFEQLRGVAGVTSGYAGGHRPLPGFLPRRGVPPRLLPPQPEPGLLPRGGGAQGGEAPQALFREAEAARELTRPYEPLHGRPPRLPAR